MAARTDVGAKTAEPTSPLAQLAGVAAIVLGGWMLLVVGWWWAGDSLVARSGMPIQPSDVRLPAPPPPVERDVAAEVFRDAGLTGEIDASQTDAAERLAHAFALHPWIDEVREVRIHHPNIVEIDLTWHRAVLMVEVPRGVYPVALSGVLLPSEDFSSREAARYPRLAGVGSAPAGLVGTHWGDPVVDAAARLAGFLKDHWVRLGLERIVTADRQPLDDPHGPPQFVLVTPSGDTRVLWGSAPGSEVATELAADKKLTRLLGLVEGTDGLDVPETIQRIDLRPLDEPTFDRAPRQATAVLDDVLPSLW